jgi:hypothetical protein
MFSGCALDVLARAPLWSMGLNYRHGTGHGVGAALNVHEGPQSISSRFYITAPLRAGMVCSNEPGYYEDGAFGAASCAALHTSTCSATMVPHDVSSVACGGGDAYISYSLLA